MSEYPLAVEEIVSWFRSKESGLGDLGIVLAGVHENRKYTPSAFADFDTTSSIGRIVVWVSGEIDFEVLRRPDGQNAFVRHESVSDLHASELENAYKDFLRKMIDPEGSEDHPASQRE